MSEPTAPGPGDLPGMPDLGGLMDQLKRVQETQAKTYEGRAGGGAVRIRANGAYQFESVSIEADAIDPTDPGMLEDLVLAALHELSAALAAAQQEAMGGFDPSQLGDTLGGLGLGGLGGQTPPEG